MIVVVLIAVALFLSIQTATHSVFLGSSEANLDNPETRVAPLVPQQRRDTKLKPKTNLTTWQNDISNVKHHKQEQEQLRINDSFLKKNTSFKIHQNFTNVQSTDALPFKFLSNSNSMSDSFICRSIEEADNDASWINTRIGNIADDPRLFPHSLYPLVLDPWSGHVVNQTICHPKSRFLGNTNSNHFSHDDWMVRLAYLEIFRHQHAPALRELQTRQSCSLNNTPRYNASIISDYRCDRNTQFLVAALPHKGAGATFRSGAVSALLAGLAMNRVVVFVNGRTFGGVQMKSIWNLASTSKCPRGDYQCYFLPTTPCVLTEEEVKHAARQQKKWLGDSLKVLQRGKALGNLTDERIIVLDAPPVPVYMTSSAKNRIRRRIYELVKDLGAKYNVPQAIIDELQSDPTAAKSALGPTQPQLYDHAASPFHHAALLYVLRPNWKFRQELDQMVQKALPTRGFHNEWSFGVPIRGSYHVLCESLFGCQLSVFLPFGFDDVASDKCKSESTCLTFDQYMQWALQQYNKYSNNATTQNVASLVLTSESGSMMRARYKYNDLNEFPFRFVVNADDTTQGTGIPRKYRGKNKGAHEVMLSTMAALKLQLMPKYSVANCCSNFHQMILDLLRAGCGAVRNPVFQCLQEADDPQFHVCCQWTSEERCKRVFEELRLAEAKQKQNSASANKQ